jgi:hypothetical protein
MNTFQSIDELSNFTVHGPFIGVLGSFFEVKALLKSNGFPVEVASFTAHRMPEATAKAMAEHYAYMMNCLKTQGEV